MKIPVDKLNIIVRCDGLALIKHARGTALEQLVTPGVAEVVRCVLEAKWRAKSVRRESGFCPLPDHPQHWF